MQNRNLRSQFLTFSRNEKRGVFVLLIFIMALLLFRFFILPQLKIIPDSDISLTEIIEEEEISSFPGRIDEGGAELVAVHNEEVELEYFNPNTIDYYGLLKLGFADKVAKNLIKYRDNGGVFKRSEDLQKLYGMDMDFYKQLIPFVIIPEEKTTQNYFGSQIKEQEEIFTLVELNSASKEQLEELTGIGDILSSRIIKYRKLLGGFVRVSQISEVYGISDSLTSTLEPFVYLDINQVTKINLNTCTEYDLSNHPYISIYDARAILKYRYLIGKYSAMTEIRDNYLLSEEDYEKVSPYFKNTN